MAGGVSSWYMAVRPLGGLKSKEKTTTGNISKVSMASPPVNRALRQVRRCYNCTRNSTCSTSDLSDRMCACRNAGRKCTAYVFWHNCQNQQMLLLSMDTARGFLGHFTRSAAWINSSLPEQLPAQSYLRTSSTDRAGRVRFQDDKKKRRGVWRHGNITENGDRIDGQGE